MIHSLGRTFLHVLCAEPKFRVRGLLVVANTNLSIFIVIIDLRQEVYDFAGVYLFVCVQHNSKIYGWILMKLSGIDCYVKIWK